ncbi:MAG: SAM-dependent methyltransferase [Verrucomicrobiota bacterium]
MTGYLAADGFLAELVAELGTVSAVHDRLVIADGPPRPAAWAADVWLNPERIAIKSIVDAGKALRARHSYWAHYSFHLHRRAQLIADQTRSMPVEPTAFPAPAPRVAIGGWALIDEHTLIAAPHRSCPFPLGEINFIENHTDPPSRAYLKLWELFSRLKVWPQAGQRCLDLGACPGGWTWVLQGLGAKVVAVDKAPLAPRIARLVECRQESAFGLKPEPTDWLFSDVICEPARLLKLVERWLPVAPNIVCTLKFKGATDHATARAFAAIPGSRVLHLHHNRHELTWFRLAPELMPTGGF